MNSDYGSYGVLHFLRKDDDAAVIASYPIDDDVLTFGKEQDCNIRLYYPTVSMMHAKLMFQDRKVRLPSDLQPGQSVRCGHICALCKRIE